MQHIVFILWPPVEEAATKQVCFACSAAQVVIDVACVCIASQSCASISSQAQNSFAGVAPAAACRDGSLQLCFCCCFGGAVAAAGMA